MLRRAPSIAPLVRDFMHTRYIRSSRSPASALSAALISVLVVSLGFGAQSQARAQEAAPPATGTAAGTTGTAAVTRVPTSAETQAAVPVDHEALETMSEQAVLPATVHEDWENDPLFYPGVALVGAGGASLLASLLTGLGAHSIYTSLEDSCPNDICTRNLRSRIDSGNTLAVVSTVLTGVGLGAIALGTVFLVIAAGREDKMSLGSSTGLSLSSGPTPLGMGATLRF